MKDGFTDPLRTWSVRLARPDILFWTLPLLMLVLVAGTVAQRDSGLYVAEHRYFLSYIIWAGFVPLPGGLTLMGIFFVNLLAKFLLFSEWQWRKSGVILAHFGVLLLIAGAGLTALTAEEGSMVIREGETVPVVEDYHQRDFRILKDGETIYARPHQTLRDGLVIADARLPWPVTITTYCYNCAIRLRPASLQAGWTEPGKFMQLQAARLDPEDEQNLTGVEFTLQNKHYLTFDKFPKPPVVTDRGHEYSFIVGRSQRPLPFSLTLKKFSRTLQPGSDLARSYRSDVTVNDHAASWPASITMNEPLRYRGYTFYQSSFDDAGATPYTVLSVVRNRGRIFPYAASLIVALGLLLQLAIRLRLPRSRS